MELDCWIQAGKGYPKSLKSLEVGDMSWQPVPVADGLRIKMSSCNDACILVVLSSPVVSMFARSSGTVAI